MGKETIITAPTMAKALSKVREGLDVEAMPLTHKEPCGEIDIKKKSEQSPTKMPFIQTSKNTANNIVPQKNINSIKKTPEKAAEKVKREIPDWIRPFAPPSKMKNQTGAEPYKDQRANVSAQAHSTQQYATQSAHALQSQEDLYQEYQHDDPVNIAPSPIHSPHEHSSEQATPQQKEKIYTDERLSIPTARSDFKKFVDATSSFDKTISAISAICDLCEYHQLGDVFGDAWLKEMNPEFTHNPIQLTPALDRILSLDLNWLDNISKRGQVVLVGPPGSGKTVTIAKLAAMLLERGKKVRVVTLDTLKSSGVYQLKQYIEPLSLELYVGLESLHDQNSQQITLIDTPSININLREDIHFLKTLRTRLAAPFTLVLPADMNPIEAEEHAYTYMGIDTDSLIVTRFELTKRYGVPLRISRQGLKLVLTSKSPELSEGLQCPSSEALLERMLSACEVSS
ncbi:MAG: hypothetical protein Q8S21_00210 [Candidatus Paracaedibacteraceae bacterium]|nr:hypothetical protein [Candidatus Paracaedibacteraceae bacterium]